MVHGIVEDELQAEVEGRPDVHAVDGFRTLFSEIRDIGVAIRLPAEFPAGGSAEVVVHPDFDVGRVLRTFRTEIADQAAGDGMVGIFTLADGLGLDAAAVGTFLRERMSHQSLHIGIGAGGRNGHAAVHPGPAGATVLDLAEVIGAALAPFAVEFGDEVADVLGLGEPFLLRLGIVLELDLAGLGVEGDLVGRGVDGEHVAVTCENRAPHGLQFPG